MAHYHPKPQHAGADERDKQDVAGGAVEGISKKDIIYNIYVLMA